MTRAAANDEAPEWLREDARSIRAALTEKAVQNRGCR
jgi:hypothetical protein